MASTTEPERIDKDTFQQKTWDYVIQWLIATSLIINFIREENGKRISRIGFVSSVVENGDIVTFKIEKCARRQVDNEETGDECSADSDQTFTLKKSITSVTMSERGHVRFEVDGIIYFITPSYLCPTGCAVIASLHD